jgi:hypothetical protein
MIWHGELREYFYINRSKFKARLLTDEMCNTINVSLNSFERAAAHESHTISIIPFNVSQVIDIVLSQN